jgi:RsiW-degrading membrane proteinase PrsW (M82 family)
MLLAISTALGLLIYTAINKSMFLEVNTSPLATILTASSLIAVGVLLLPTAKLSLDRLRGMESKTFQFPPIRPRTWIVVPIIWLLAVILASLFYNAPGASWYTPFLHFLAIALPVYLVIRIAINRIPLGSSLRSWGVFGSGMTLSPFLSSIFEGLIIILGVVAFGVYLGLNPEKMFDIERLASQIQQAPNMESLVFLLEPLLKNPLTLILMLTLLSGFVPVIEEIFKSLGVWLVIDRLSTPAQGFAMGVLSGAGFALAESLFASVTTDATWAFTLSMRAISGAMHMLTAGLTGWGIAYARLEKRYLRLIGMVLLAMLLHSAWNAGAVLAMAGGVGVLLSTPDFDIFSSLMILAGAGLIFVLVSGVFVAIVVINARLRTTPHPSQMPGKTGEAPGAPGEGTGDGGVK